jgi:BirA family biotin operon repressor/biotin-[acetyl-CoA-carboxylase] ligase
MKILKLDAIDSTNSYLRDLVKQEHVENWTVVIADHQTHGKGQFDNKWSSEKGKNLTFSVLIRFKKLDVEKQFYLNYAISIALYNVLKYYIPEKLAVKWPNDILSANQKLGGILIECIVKNSSIDFAIAGIGLNVNQQVFPSPLTLATSLKNLLNRTINKEELLDKILLEMQYQMLLIQKQKFGEIKYLYEDILYKKGIPSMFVDGNKNTFLGKIVGISSEGKLTIELENESLRDFDLKEIKFA